ncbi:MAG: DUF3343 domain-containing protein [Defluviitaleaceae bacterium]|nr:DUF3343 domain-containing protein [Defluviitaleaceae bacterium]
MNKYIATFFSHYDALIFFSLLKENDIVAKLAPVPRKVSASCGTCVAFDYNSVVNFPDCEIEAIYVETDGKFSEVWI